MNTNRTKPALAWLLCALLAVSLALPALAADDDGPSGPYLYTRYTDDGHPNLNIHVFTTNPDYTHPALTLDENGMIVLANTETDAEPGPDADMPQGSTDETSSRNPYGTMINLKAGQPFMHTPASLPGTKGNAGHTTVDIFLKADPRSNPDTGTLTVGGNEVVILDGVTLHRLTAEGNAQIITTGDTSIDQITLGGKATLINTGTLTTENLFLLQKSIFDNQGDPDVQRIMKDETATLRPGPSGSGSGGGGTSGGTSGGGKRTGTDVRPSLPTPITNFQATNAAKAALGAAKSIVITDDDPGANPYGPVIDDGDDTSGTTPGCTCIMTNCASCASVSCGGSGCACIGVGVNPLP